MTVHILKKEEDILVDQMTPVPMIKYWREENKLSEEETNRLNKYESKIELIKDLIQHFKFEAH